MGTWGQSVTMGTWVQGAVRGSNCCSGYMKAGGPIHVHGAGGAATYSRYVGWVSS